MSDAVENNLLRGRLSSLNRILLRVPVYEDILFGYFGDPTAVNLAVELDGELHNHSVSPNRPGDAGYDPAESLPDYSR
jgi:hypothetical protein